MIENNVIVSKNILVDKEKQPKYGFKVFFIAIVVAFLIFVPYLVYDKGAFVYYGDFDVQQVPFYRLCHNAIKSGEFGFNIFTDLGVNFIGSYSFYTLGSPFFWFTLLFSNEFVPYLMAPLLILKFGLTAVTGYAYIKLFVKNPNMAVIGGLLYSFSGFNIYNIFFNHFNEVVLFFPLLLISMERFIREGKRYNFAIAVFICSLVNYYFFFGQVIFCTIYFFVRLGCNDFKVSFKQFLNLSFEAVIGLLGSCFLLIPALMALTGNPRTGDFIEGFNQIIYGESQRYGLIISSLFFPPDIPARPNFFPNSNAKWSSVSAFIPLFSMTGVFTFFKYRGNHFIKTLLKISLLIAFVPILNSVFSAFNYSYYARWFYMPILIMVLATMLVIEDDIKDLKYGLKMSTAFVFYFALIGIVPKKINVGEYEWFALPEYVSWFWVYVLVAVVGLFSVLFLILLGTKTKLFYPLTIGIFCVITVGYSVFMLGIGKLQGTGYENIMTNGHNATIDLPVSLEDEFYRVDTFDEMDNLAMFWGLPTINAFHSIVPASITEYYDLIEYRRNVGSRIEPDEIGVRGITNVLYSFVSEEKVTNNYSPMLGFSYLDTQHGYQIYQNDYFIPFGVGYDNQVTHAQLMSAGQFRDRILVNGIYFGFDENGKEYELLPPIYTDELENSHLYDNSYLANCEYLAQNYLQKLEFNSYGFTGVYNALRPQALFISLPYDDGFSATVNDNPVQILKANGGFMAVPVNTGVNKVVFTYKTPGLELGIKVSIFALFVFLIYVFFTARKIEYLTYSEELEDIGLNLDNKKITKELTRLNLESESERETATEIEDEYVIIEENNNEINQ